MPTLDEYTLAVDIVVPVYNEDKVLETFHRQLRQVIDKLPHNFKIYYINDGSSDGTSDLLQKVVETDERVIAVELSRNFGHQAALTAGLDLANGDVVITMDGDGQHPPELIPQMIDLFRAGYDIVLTQRTNDQKLPFFKRQTSILFYRILNQIADTKIAPGTADCRLMSRVVVDAFKQMQEYHRFLRGMIPWMGYKTVILPYSAPERLGGKSKYSLRKMAKLAMDAIFSFSLIPLQVGIALGFLFFILAGIEVVYVLSFWFCGQQSLLTPGWSSLMFMLLLVGGILMVIMGFIGIYVGYIFQEVKHRPIYLVRTIQPQEPRCPKSDASCAIEKR